MLKLDKRKNYYLTIDTETANSLDCPFVYDIGGAVHDKKGVVYETFSFVIYDVFVKMKDLMQTAYYKEKIPQYEIDLQARTKRLTSFYTARQYIKAICEKYDIKAIIAHNAYFDYKALTNTQRFLTKSKYRYFLPYGIPIWDTLSMARDTICKQKSYIRFCEDNEYMYKNRPRATAEILYRYISGKNDFNEKHTGLEDVLIEKEIFVQCMRQHKKMKKELFNKKE